MSSSDIWQYLQNCSERSIESFILERMSSASRHARAIKAEQQQMVNDLADATIARILLEHSHELRRVLEARCESSAAAD